MKKILMIFAVLILFAQVASAQAVPPIRPDAESYCFDFTKTLDEDTVREINNEGGGLKRAFDIDFLVVMVPSLEGREVVDYAVDLFSKWEIGKSTQGKKGLLILIAKQDQKIKIEVGYDLEGIYTDLYVGQVERDILKEFLEQGVWGTGFLATIESFVFRIYNKDLMKEVKEISAPKNDLEYYSQGAGASTGFDFAAALKQPLPTTPQELRDYFSAQPTPKQCFERYLLTLAKNMNDYTLDLYTFESQEFFKTQHATSGQRQAELQELQGLGYYVKQKNDHAVIFFGSPDDKKITNAGVYFIRKTEKGWQMDINAMARSLQVVGPGWVVLRERYHPYTEIIMGGI